MALGIGAGVVEDDTVGVDVELAVGVARDASGARGLDINERHAIGGIEDGRALVAWGAAIGDDLSFGVGEEADGAGNKQQDGHSAGCQDEAGKVDCRRLASLAVTVAAAVALGAFSHGHQDAARLVVDQAIALLVHAGIFFGIETRRAGVLRIELLANCRAAFSSASCSGFRK